MRFYSTDSPFFIEGVGNGQTFTVAGDVTQLDAIDNLDISKFRRRTRGARVTRSEAPSARGRKFVSREEKENPAQSLLTDQQLYDASPTKNILHYVLSYARHFFAQYGMFGVIAFSLG
jgi:hypothetical protein